MRRLRIAVVVIGLSVLVACSMWGRQKKDWSGATSGEQLERLWWNDIKDQRFDTLEQHVAASFVGMTPEAVLDRARLVQYWRQLAISDFTLGDFVTQSNGADLTVAYRASFHGAQSTAAVRWRVLSVWQQTRHGWILTAQSVTPDANN